MHFHAGNAFVSSAVPAYFADMTPSPSIDVPEGFAPIFRSSPFLDTIGPLYSKGTGAQLVIGWRVEPKHTNARGSLHGGVLATLADVALGYSLATSGEMRTSMVTASLSIDFAGSAAIGDWVETSVDIQKRGSRLAFANAYFNRGSERIARASGVFLVLKQEEARGSG
jgi:acyl-coenzyme A thioesterase 13